MSLLAVLNPALDLTYSILTTVSSGVRPLVGGASVALALVIVTLLARACLLPLAVSVLRAERAKQALAPTLERIRRRYGRDSARLTRELQAAYRKAGVSPLAGMLPALAQAPVMIIVYRLGKVPVIAGTKNVVLAARLFTAPLGGHGLGVIATAGIFASPSLVVLALVVVLIVLAHFSSRQQVRRIKAATIGEVPAMQLMIARITPYGTVLTAAVVPLAVSLYLVTSTAWLLAERAILPRMF